MVELAQKYKEFLIKNNLDIFEIEEVADSHKSVIFRAAIGVKGQQVPVCVIFDNTIYAIVRVNIAAKAVNDTNADEINNYIRLLNYQTKLFKYYLTPDTTIIMDACIPIIPAAFSPDLIQLILNVVIQEIESIYPKFMKLIWSNQTSI